MNPRTQEKAWSPSELAERTVYRRAVEAVVWGMPAVNYDLMLRAMPGGADKTWKLPDIERTA